MHTKDIILKFRDIQHRVTEAIPLRIRPAIGFLDLVSRRSALLLGPRGVGKTTCLLLEARKRKVLYASADHPLLANCSLNELADAAFREGYEGLAIDEAHFAKNWSQEVKALYDSNPKKIFWVSDSSSLLVRKGIGDLSRRFPVFTLPLLSFREYISLATEVNLSSLNPFSLGDTEEWSAVSPYIAQFSEYLRIGSRPFFFEGDYEKRMLNIIEKSIYHDVPFLFPSIAEQHLRLMNAIVGSLACSSIPTLHIDSLSRDWSVGKEKLYDILHALEHIGMIHIVRHRSDKKASGKGAKMFLADPSMYHALHGNVGNIREAFLVSSCRAAGKQIFAMKDERKGDFEIDGVSVEVGGARKERKSAQYVIRDDIDSPQGHVLPLWMFGFLY